LKKKHKKLGVTQSGRNLCQQKRWWFI